MMAIRRCRGLVAPRAGGSGAGEGAKGFIGSGLRRQAHSHHGAPQLAIAKGAFLVFARRFAG